MNASEKLIAVGYKGCAFLPKGAPVEGIRLNTDHVLDWDKYGPRKATIGKLSEAGEVSGCIQTDLCLIVGKSQFGNCNNPDQRKVWIGTLEKARQRGLVQECEFTFKGNLHTGYATPGNSIPQYLATDALPGGRVESKKITDATGFDRNSSRQAAPSSLKLKKYGPSI